MHKILIINDSPAINKVLKTRLESGGFSVETVETGEGGIKKARKGLYQLILVDYKLPDIDGGKICWLLKREKDTKDTPIIFMSAQDEGKLCKIIEDAGADGYIDVPFEGKELIEKITGFIKTRMGADKKRISADNFRKRK